MEKAPRQDFVVRTWARREANGLPLMAAELVIAGAETRQAHPAAETYPLHFRKTYFPARLHDDPQVEFELHLLASRLSRTPPPIGHTTTVFRSCLIPGQSYARLTPFGGEPPENNIAKAQNLSLATAAGLWRLAEEALAQLLMLQDGGLAHGDTELHNIIVCPAPLEPILVDFEAAVRRDTIEPAAWDARCARISSRSFARRSISNARSGDSQASSASYRGAGSRRCFALPIDFDRPSTGRPKSESPTLSFRKGARNTLDTGPSPNLRHLAPVGCGHATTLQGPLRLFSSGIEETTYERKHGTASSDHGSNELQTRGPAPRLQGHARRRRCSAPTSSAWPR